jgi:tRNA(Ile)-lysidine synthase
MLESLYSILYDECHLDRSALFLVGVSGGPDSLCLMDVLHRLGYRLHVVHVNHQLRPQAGEDMQLVQRAAQLRGLPFSSCDVNVLETANRSGWTVEEAARNLRYRYLFEQAALTGAQAVVVGHNADDQVETILMNLLRGSGLTGLRGMPVFALPNAWSDKIPLVRPLLRTWRTEIDAYCVENGLQPAQDLSNLDPAFTRNRLRVELIPFLESYQPGVRNRLLRLGRLVSAEDALLDELAQKAWQACLRTQGERFINLSLSALCGQPLALQRRILRRAVDILRPGLTDVGFEDIERAMEFVKQPARSRQIDWMAGLRLLTEGDHLWLAGWEADLPQPGWPQVVQEMIITVPGSTILPGGWILTAEAVELDTDGLQRVLLNRDPYQVWLDAKVLEQPLLLRGRREADTYQPLGMNGQTVKLKDWMINQKLPRRARLAWPLLCAAGQVAWIPGFQPAHWARITPETRQILHFKLFPAQSAENSE